MNYYTVNGNDKWNQVSDEHYTYKIHAAYSRLNKFAANLEKFVYFLKEFFTVQ